MLGRTHFFVGTAVSLAVLHPQSMSSLVAGAGAAAIGSMISDVDSGTSQAHQEADKIMAAVIAVSAVVIILDYKFHVGIYNRLMRDSSIARLLTGVLGFLVICLYGRDTPHRCKRGSARPTAHNPPEPPQPGRVFCPPKRKAEPW